MARFDLALLIILIFHDRNRFFNHQSRRTHLIHNVDERDPPSKGCIRNGIISSHPPPPSRGRNIFFARLFTNPANNRENATRIIIWASRGVLSPARDEKRRVSCVRKVCAREFFFFLFFLPSPLFFRHGETSARTPAGYGFHGDYDGVEKYAPGVCHLQSRGERRGLAPDEFLIADEEKERPRCASMPCRKKKKKKKKVYRYRSLNNTLPSPNPEVKARAYASARLDNKSAMALDNKTFPRQLF